MNTSVSEKVSGNIFLNSWCCSTGHVGIQKLVAQWTNRVQNVGDYVEK
jgi:hypothetical protein